MSKHKRMTTKKTLEAANAVIPMFYSVVLKQKTFELKIKMVDDMKKQKNILEF